MRTARERFDLEGSDRVAQDVAQVGGVPIEAFDVSHLMLSIYDDRIYSQRDIPSSRFNAFVQPTSQTTASGGEIQLLTGCPRKT